jgi:gliding motility-associated-like protein
MQRHFQKFILLLLINAAGIQSNGQSPFIKSIGTNNSDFGTSVIVLPDNSFALTMEISLNAPLNDSVAGTLVKTDCIGEVEWSRNFVIDQVNVAIDVIHTVDNSLLTEVISFQPPGMEQHVSIIKTDLSGNLMWCKKLPLLGTNENKLLEDSQGNIYVLANTKLVQGNYDKMGLLKFSSDGILLWAKEYSFTYGCTPINMAPLPNGQFVLLSRMAIPGNSFTDAALTLIDATGQQIKTIVAGTYYDDEPQEVITDPVGNIHVCGRTYFLSRNWDAFHFVFYPNLNLQKKNFFDGNTSNGEIFRRCIRDDNSKIILAGDEGTFDERNLLVVKSNYSGVSDWSKHYTIATAYTNYIMGICKNNGDGYVFTGDVHTIRLRDALLMQMDSSGSAGCLSSPFNLTVYHDDLTLIDTLFTETQLSIIPVDTIPFVAPDPVTTIQQCGQPMCILFEAVQDSVCPLPCIQLTDMSTGNTTVSWDIQHTSYIETSTDPAPHVCFESEGDYRIGLIISNGQDTLRTWQTIHVEKDCPLFIPNIFTPNNDHVNDEFKIRELPNQFNLQVFNRWGNLVFKSSDPSEIWNGENENGKLVSAGTYYYILQLTAENKEMKGWVEVVY